MENKLIPMTDFVLSILNNTSPNNFVKGVESIRAYAEFLKQPLALWMFVPCDEEGKPLEEPTKEKYGWFSSTSYEEESGWMYEGGEDKYQEAFTEWQKSKERVFFEFKLLSDYNGMYRLRNAQNVDITFDSYGCYAEPFDSIPGKRINTIEEITYLDLTLTETAKQIYGS
ncbi:hypothetical protein HZQ92_05510 [Elizabethkingia anophelis]|nr:hypothetical protein [Elizabethkingia anophelis]MCT3823049.1 hypothetical protein [Elizabethkingia anophelis]MCT3930367.1 hypothetical protein [Elizabethkingia anophelis]MCT4111989.1 hypothetical protein [Elizabethkingia anophelis]